MAKQKSAASLIDGNDPTSRLYRAVVRYVESKGGCVVVIGGVQVQRWPGDPALNFTVGIKCTGRFDETVSLKPAEIDQSAAALGSKGGKKRMAGLSKKERSELAKMAARKRWNKS